MAFISLLLNYLLFGRMIGLGKVDSGKVNLGKEQIGGSLGQVNPGGCE